MFIYGMGTKPSTSGGIEPCIVVRDEILEEMKRLFHRACNAFMIFLLMLLEVDFNN